MTSLSFGWMSWCLSIRSFSGRIGRERSASGLVAEIPAERGHRLPGGPVGVGVREGLGRGVTLVADLLEGKGDRPEVEVSRAGRPAVRVDEVDVCDLTTAAPDRGRDVLLLDIHVEQVGQ